MSDENCPGSPSGVCSDAPDTGEVESVCKLLEGFSESIRTVETAEEIAAKFQATVRGVLKATKRDELRSFDGANAAIQDVLAAADTNRSGTLQEGLQFAAISLRNAVQKNKSTKFVESGLLSCQKSQSSKTEIFCKSEQRQITRLQCAEILAGGLFGLIDRKRWGVSEDGRDVQNFTFRKLWAYDGKAWGGDTLNFVLMGVLLYFAQVSKDRERLSAENVIIARKGISPAAWEQVFEGRSAAVFCPVSIEDSGVSIHDERFMGESHLQVDFANEYLGGGVLSGGGSQEESMFVEFPELLVTMFLEVKMSQLEAIEIAGVRRFIQHNMQGSSKRRKTEQYCRVSPDRRDATIVAMDAICYGWSNPKWNQYAQKDIQRELTKCLVAISRPVAVAKGPAGLSVDFEAREFVTGLWGCGAFRGDPQLKFVIQWIACSLLMDRYGKRQIQRMFFCPFEKNEDFLSSLENFRSHVVEQGVSVKQIWDCLMRDEYQQSNDTFKYLMDNLPKQDRS